MTFIDGHINGIADGRIYVNDKGFLIISRKIAQPLDVGITPFTVTISELDS